MLIFNLDGIKNEVKPVINKSKIYLKTARDIIASINVPNDFSYQSELKKIPQDITNIEEKVENIDKWLNEIIIKFSNAESKNLTKIKGLISSISKKTLDEKNAKSSLTKDLSNYWTDLRNSINSLNIKAKNKVTPIYWRDIKTSMNSFNKYKNIKVANNYWNSLWVQWNGLNRLKIDNKIDINKNAKKEVTSNVNLNDINVQNQSSKPENIENISTNGNINQTQNINTVESNPINTQATINKTSNNTIHINNTKEQIVTNSNEIKENNNTININTEESINKKPVTNVNEVIEENNDEIKIDILEDLEKTNYNEIKNILIENYNIAEEDIPQIMSVLENSTQMDIYNCIVNCIVESFKDSPDEFGRNFGFSLYETDNNLNKINKNRILLELFMYFNDIDNGGTLIKKDINEKDLIILETGKEQLLTLDDEINTELINGYLKFKESKLNFNIEEIDIETKDFVNIIKEEFNNKIKQDEQIILEVNIESTQIKLEEIETGKENIYSEESKKQYIFITEINEEELLVNYSGKKCKIKISEIEKDHNLSIYKFSLLKNEKQ